MVVRHLFAKQEDEGGAQRVVAGQHPAGKHPARDDLRSKHRMYVGFTPEKKYEPID